jgi:glycosyltransferase involved in cell wall biosynthesis
MDVSIIVPALNEEKNISLLFTEIKKAMNCMKHSYEVIFVDDGSTDNTLKQILLLAKKDKKVKYIKFKRNFGKASALSAGFKYAKGNIIITMDADLQDDPRDIPRFIEKLKDCDLVAGWRYKRRDKFFKKLFSKIFNKLAVMLTNVRIHDFNCGFKAYKKEVIKSIKIYGELYRYIPSLAKQKGFKVRELKVRHHRRKHGITKYGTSRLMRGFLDLITVNFLNNYSRRPLHFFGALAIAFTAIGTLIGMYLTLGTLLYNLEIFRPSLILSVLMILIGLQFFSIGLFSEMLISYSIQDEIGAIIQKKN